ncbi:MAG: 3-hydroxyacyl-CoA dehydrogenase NAD-binding domain-containing protein [Chloroflexota bacterium]
MVIGAGTMGRGIAQVVADAGYPTLLHDADEAGLQRGLDAIRQAWSRLEEKGKRTAEQTAAAVSLLRPASSLGEAAEVKMVIEAVFENLEVKTGLFRELDRIVPGEGVLASNTSSISVTKLASATTSPERVVGLHFFNPVPVLPLVEVVRAVQTSDATTDRAVAFATSLGKTPVVVQDSPGFVATRILLPMINEAIFALGEGVASAEAIDQVMKLGMAHPMGPLALADLIGLDVCLDILQTLHRDFGDDKYRPAPLLTRMVAAGRLGRKSGEGFFVYADGR